METSDPASNVWEDKGMVVCSSSDRGMNDWSRPNLNNWDAYFYFNAIDPTYLVDKDGTHWLIYGSWHSGIAEVELNPETGLPKTSLGKPLGNFYLEYKYLRKVDSTPWYLSLAGLGRSGSCV